MLIQIYFNKEFNFKKPHLEGAYLETTTLGPLVYKVTTY